VSYSLAALAALLGIEPWQAEQAVRDDLLPGPDCARRRWSEKLAAVVLPMAESIRAAAGDVPDCGAWRASDYLGEKFGMKMTAGGVEELAARGLIRTAGEYKGYQMYSGSDLARFGDAGAAAAAEAARDRNGDDAAAYMGIRPADFKRLAKCGFIKPARHVYGKWGPAALYSAAALDEFLARDDIDWAAVRATPAGRRSPLYDLCEPELTMLALASLGQPRIPGVRR
jgi:hypothetical protein